jgi:hypothetical protein
MSLNITQAMALENIHRKLLDKLHNYSAGKTDSIFFFGGMETVIHLIDNFVRENSSYNCSYRRDSKIADKFLPENMKLKKES